MKPSKNITPEEQLLAREKSSLIFELLCATRMLGIQGTSHGANFSAAMGGVEALGMAFVEGAPTPIVFLAEDGSEPRPKPLLAALADDSIGDNGWPLEYLAILRESLDWAMNFGESAYAECMRVAGNPHKDPPRRRMAQEAHCARPLPWSIASDVMATGSIPTARLARIAATKGFDVDPVIFAFLEAHQIAAASSDGSDHSTLALRL